jgi:predicted DNA-binding ribbon-helix-helix protein
MVGAWNHGLRSGYHLEERAFDGFHGVSADDDHACAVAERRLADKGVRVGNFWSSGGCNLQPVVQDGCPRWRK